MLIIAVPLARAGAPPHYLNNAHPHNIQASHTGPLPRSGWEDPDATQTCQLRLALSCRLIHSLVCLAMPTHRARTPRGRLWLSLRPGAGDGGAGSNPTLQVQHSVLAKGTAPAVAKVSARKLSRHSTSWSSCCKLGDTAHPLPTGGPEPLASDCPGQNRNGTWIHLCLKLLLQLGFGPWNIYALDAPGNSSNLSSGSPSTPWASPPPSWPSPC